MSNGVSEGLKDRLVVAYATDLKSEEKTAFEHAVAVAAHARGQLYAVHATEEGERDAFRNFPEAEPLLTRWQAADRPLGADLHEEVEYHKVLHTCCDDPVDTLLDALNDIKPDLLVVGKHRLSGVQSFFHDSVAESLARNANVPTLFVPLRGEGFVSSLDGDLDLDRVVIPVQDQATIVESLDKTRAIISKLDIREPEYEFVHVRDGEELRNAVVPETDEKINWHAFETAGDLREAIADTVNGMNAKLIAMGTHGHDSLADVFQGSRTEQVVRLMPCPVLSIPLEGA